MEEVGDTLFRMGGKERTVLFEGAQVSASRPSGKGSKKVKTLAKFYCFVYIRNRVMPPRKHVFRYKGGSVSKV
jgi:hypothetical protein